MAERLTYRLGDLIFIKHGFAFKSEYFGDKPGDPILVTPGNFAIGGGFKEAKSKTYSGPIPDGFILSEGDLVVTMTDLSKSADTLGYPALIPPGFYLHNQRIGRIEIVASGLLDKSFLYYALCARDYRQHVVSTATGTTVKHTSPSRIYDYCIDLPRLPEQKAIADALRALDEKIALNERVAVATDALTAALFRHMMMSSMEITEGLLGDVASVNKTTVKPSREGVLRYVDISAVKVGSYEWPELMNWRDAPGRARRKASFGDTIWSTVRPNRRSHALVLDDDADLIFSTGLVVLTPTSVGPAFLYESARTPAFQQYLESVAEGSAYPAVRPERFKAAPILLPSVAERSRFENMAMALRLRAHQATLESRTLVDLRDTLLPQLMSGRLCVKDAEKIVEDVT